MSILRSVKHFIRDKNRERWLKELRARNRNTDFTLITNNCIGGVIYHDLGLRFLSPTINLTIQDFPTFIEHFDHYMHCELTELPSDRPFPVGRLESVDPPPITILFNHYASFAEAKEKWEARKARINYDNLFFVMNCYNHFYPEEFAAYLRLPPAKNKAAVVAQGGVDRPDIHVVHWKTGTADRPVFGRILDVKLNGKRYLDEFDYVAFLNGEA